MIATVADAVKHALTHVDTVQKDGERLQRRTGCCVPELPAASAARPRAARAMTTIERAGRGTAEAVLMLLERTHLPLDGLAEHIGTAWSLRAGTTDVGGAALEVYADGALLRSVAVDPAVQNQGVGRQLTLAALSLAADLHVPAVYLLTTTAERFFPRFGFERIARADVPASVQSSVEFRSACPSTAVVMRKQL